ncbi:MAG: DUF6263 family protein [Bacteroidota bacterium]
MKTLRFIVLLLIASAFTPADDVKLKYTFLKGEEYQWSQVVSQTIKQSFGGMDQIIENTIRAVLKIKVIEVTPTGAKLETQYINMAMFMKMPAGMGDMTLESDGPQDKSENKVMKALTGKPFFVHMSGQGKIEKIENIENLWSGLAGAGLEQQQLALMKQQLQESLGEKSIRNSFENGFIVYPDKTVKVGDKWSQKTGMPGNFPLLLDNNWSVTSIAKDVVKFSSEGTIVTTNKDQLVSLPNGLKSKVDLSGGQKLYSSVDPKTGWPKEVKSTSEMKGTLKLLAGGMIPQDMDVPMSILTESTYTIIKK